MTDLARENDPAPTARPRGRHRAADDPYRVPPPRTDGLVLRVVHEADGGFCTVCGSVWPCARSRRGDGPAHVLRPESTGRRRDG